MQKYKFKVVLLGEGRVGKTSILLRYIEGRFTEHQRSTIQASYLEKRLNLDSCAVTLSIWDTAGQERFHALAPIYYRDANGAILVYDITDKTSFTKVQDWVEELRKIVGDDIILIMAANKQDLSNKMQVREAEAEQYAQLAGAKIVKTSAKTGKGVEELFLALTQSLLKKEKAKQQRTSTGSARYGRAPKSGIKIIEDDRPKTKDSCCTLL